CPHLGRALPLGLTAWLDVDPCGIGRPFRQGFGRSHGVRAAWWVNDPPYGGGRVGLERGGLAGGVAGR
ncbi:MAG: hypothetical protein AAGH83_04270, partial [Pseudomonadota bacterium]